MIDMMFSQPDWLKNAKCEVDPYLRVAIASTLIDHEGAISVNNEFFPLIIEAKPNRIEEVLILIGFEPTNQVDTPASFSDSRFITARVNAISMMELHLFDAVKRIEIGWSLHVQRQRVTHTRGAFVSAQAPVISTTSKLIGIIDNGCPFAHEAIRSPLGVTRVLSIWDQNDEFGSAAMPYGMSYGRVLSRPLLKKLMTNATVGGVLSESLCYKASGLDMLQQGRSHGAHVLGLATGEYKYRAIGKSQTEVGKIPLADKASRSDIVFVQLPRSAIQAPSRGSQTLHLLNGLRYFVACAGKKTKDIYAVIDYGSYLGPHDATSLFERAVDELVRQVAAQGKRLHVVFAVGNGRQEHFHASFQSKKNIPKQIELWIPPANEVSVFVEIWLYRNSKFDSLKLTTPDRKISTTCSALNSVNSIGDIYSPVAIVSASRLHDDQQCIVIRIGPTRVQGKYQPAQDGRWLVELQAESTNLVHCYISRGGRNFGAPRRSQQARWKIPQNSPTGAAIDISIDYTTIGAGCGDEVMMVGSYNSWKPKESTKYSGRGPRRGGKQVNIGPARLYPGEEAQTLRGIRGIGNYSGSSYRLVGTSTAPPQAVR